jgi:hypothetical protein
MTNLSRHAFAHSLARGAAPHAHWPVAGSGEGPKYLLGVRGLARFHVPTFDHYARHSRQRPMISRADLAIEASCGIAMLLH